jgi:hypothetical protein
MILKELAGRSDDDSQFIYLSDGGHFDNLGLHEMLRRRCSRIVVIDAGRDENYAYADLGRTLQHALIDLRVQINFVTPRSHISAKNHRPKASYSISNHGSLTKLRQSSKPSRH